MPDVVNWLMQEQDEMRKKRLEVMLETQKEAVVAAALAGEISVSDAVRRALPESLQHASLIHCSMLCSSYRSMLCLIHCGMPCLIHCSMLCLIPSFAITRSLMLSGFHS